MLAPLYNMVAPAGMAAQLASNLTALGYTISIDGHVRTIDALQGGYGLEGEVTTTSASDSQPLYAVVATLWGDPSAPVHDAERGQCAEKRRHRRKPKASSPTARCKPQKPLKPRS